MAGLSLGYSKSGLLRHKQAEMRKRTGSGNIDLENEDVDCDLQVGYFPVLEMRRKIYQQE